MAVLDPQMVDRIVELCRRHGVTSLYLVGSAASGRFDPNRSDYDFLVEFPKGVEKGWDGPYFKLFLELQAMLGRPVDLIELPNVRNPFLRASLERTKQMLYAA